MENVALLEHPEHQIRSEFPVNCGFACVGWSEDPPPKRTFVVLGPARGGTSMVAQVLVCLGVPMGVSIPAPPELVNYEDPAFVRVFNTASSNLVDWQTVAELIGQRDAAYDVWGFKLPAAMHTVRQLNKLLRQPYYLMVFRDILAVGMRETIAMGVATIGAMRGALAFQELMLSFLTETDRPVLLLSYEKALQFPELFIRSIARFCGLDLEEKTIPLALGCITPNNGDYVRRVAQARRELGIRLREF